MANRSQYASLMRERFGSVYQLAYRMTLSGIDAADVVRETFVRAYKRCPDDADLSSSWQLVISVAAEVSQEQQRARDQLSFVELDSTIRNDPTQSSVHDQLPHGDRDMLLWELKQGCLTAVLNCLPPGERIAFILTEMQGSSPEQAAETLGIKPSALRVRISRARKKIAGYLTPRCEHVNPLNPCHCPSRLGVALTKGFIGEVRGKRASLRGRPFDQEPPAHDAVALFQTLPEGGTSSELLEQMLGELEAGLWDDV